MRDLVIVCSDLFGIEIYSLICEINRRHRNVRGEDRYRIEGFLLTDPGAEKIAFPAPVLGLAKDWTPKENEFAVLALLKPDAKKEAAALLREKGARFETIIAPWMLAIPEQMKIGEGSIISAYSAKAGIEIGSFVTVIGAMLSGHSIGDYSTVMRFANIAGDSIGSGSYIGNHCFLAVGRSIGDNCTVADGGVVVGNVRSGTSVSGVPARKIKE